MESLWIEFWVTSKDLNAQRVGGEWGFLQYKLNYTKSKPTTIREQFFLVV